MAADDTGTGPDALKKFTSILVYRSLRLGRWLAVNLLICLLLLLILEGAASLWWTLRQAPAAAPQLGEVAERQHTAYDPLLGWSNLPELTISNMYGVGRHLSINSHGFRGMEELRAAVGPRLIVSGDSFSFGYGVGDEHTWAAELERLFPGLEVLNMALGGYGLCQAYLWYRRDGADIPHDLHIMAFITEDYRRMTRDRFMGYGKPVLTLKDDQLHVDNIPVPRQRIGADWLSQFTGRYGDLRLVSMAMKTIAARQAARTARWQARRQTTALRLFEDLHRMHTAAGRRGVLVHLPVKEDYFNGDSDGWRDWLHAEADRRGWIFIDLVEEYRRLPADRIDELFIADDIGRYRGARGHYTEQGNRLVAHALAHHLAGHPLLAGRLEPCCAPVRKGTADRRDS